MYKILFSILLISHISFAQNTSDALLISQDYISGSARFQSMGGAFTALGGELSAMQLNPAAGSVFLEGEANISYSISSIDNQSVFYNKGGENEATYNNINQLGIVFVINNTNNSSIVKYALGVNYNRKNNFNENLSFEGNNNTGLDVFNGNDLMYSGYSSMAVSFMLEANGYSPNNLNSVENMAFSTFLIDINDTDSPFYNNNYSDYTDEDPVYTTSTIANNSFQEYNKTRSGYTGQYTFSASLDIDDKFYLGASYNRSDINMITNTTLKESEFDSNSHVDNFTYKSYVNTIGSGSNFSIGIIMRPNDFIRIGAAYHSSTKYKLYDEYNYSLDVNYNTAPDASEPNALSYSDETSNSFFEYEIHTPYKANAGIAFILGKSGLISADYEYISYSSTKLGPKNDFYQENTEIRETMNSTNNIRIGTEWKISFISLRSGYSYQQSPYKNKDFQSDTQSFSLGGGLNFKTWSFDIAYQKFVRDSDYYIYEPEMVDAAQINRNESNFVATLRFKM